MERLTQNARYAWRQLAMRPGWTAVCVLSLAFGIGVNATVFSFVNAVLLDPFPYREAGRLEILWDTKTDTITRGLFPQDVDQWRQQSSVLDGVAQFIQIDLAVGESETETVHGSRTDWNLFQVLGAAPDSGRTLVASDEAPGFDRVAVVSHGFAQRRFGSSANAIGKTVVIDGDPFTIVGAMRSDFFFPDYGSQLWLPWGSMKGIQAPAVARLKKGVTVAEAHAQLHAIATQVRLGRGDSEYLAIPGIVPLYDSVVGDSSTALWLMLAAVGLVLLIACANLANLLMARGIEREKELAIRATIGASRNQIAGQLLTESLLLAGIAGAAGLILAFWGLESIRRFDLTQVPRLDRASLSPAVLLFTVTVTCIAGLSFGLAPALKLSRPNLDAQAPA